MRLDLACPAMRTLSRRCVDQDVVVFVVLLCVSGVMVVRQQSKKVCSCVGPAATVAAAVAHPNCQIEVRSVLGRSYHLDVHAGMSVLDVKRMLCERMEHRYPPDQQRLIFAGKALDDNRQLADHSIAVNQRDMQCLHLVFRLRGC